MEENQTPNSDNSSGPTPEVPAPENPAPQPPTPPAETAATTDDDNKLITYLCYLGILVVIPLIVKKDDPFVKFHAKQGLVLVIGWFIGSFLYPLLGLGALVHLAVVILSIMGLINVNNGTMKDLPFIGGLAKKFNF